MARPMVPHEVELSDEDEAQLAGLLERVKAEGCDLDLDTLLRVGLKVFLENSQAIIDEVKKRNEGPLEGDAAAKARCEATVRVALEQRKRR